MTNTLCNLLERIEFCLPYLSPTGGLSKSVSRKLSSSSSKPICDNVLLSFECQAKLRHPALHQEGFLSLPVALSVQAARGKHLGALVATRAALFNSRHWGWPQLGSWA